jgi:hemerythrin
MLEILELLPSSSDNSKSVSVSVSDIVYHLTTHFSDEESCMRVYEFPAVKEHALMHDFIQNHFIRVLKSPVPVLQQDLTGLKMMILEHIVKDDEVFMDFLNLQE